MLLVVVDGSPAEASADSLNELLTSLVCSNAMGAWADTFPALAIACGPRLFSTSSPLSSSTWSFELKRLIDAHAAAGASPQSMPGIAALTQLQPPLSQAKHITFVTAVGSSSCAEEALRSTLASLEHRRQHVELCMVGEPSTIPSALLLLQAEYAFTATALPDRLAMSAWLASSVASRQSVSLTLKLTPPADNDVHGSKDAGCWLRCSLAPALLSEDVAEDVLVCVCHGQPIDGRSSSRLLPTRSRRTLCPVSQLDLDARDLRTAGCVGQYLCLDGPLTTTAAALNGEGASGCVLPAPRSNSGGGAPVLTLCATRRVHLAELDLTSLFGHPWRLVPNTPDVAFAPAGADGDGADDEDVEEAHAFLLRGLATRLHESAEALLCRFTHRAGFGAASQLPSNAHALLAANAVLVPTGPPQHSLMLKAIGSPAQIVPLPASELPFSEPADVERASAGLALATTALAGLPETADFNPLHHCAHGSAALLVHCATTATSAASGGAGNGGGGGRGGRGTHTEHSPHPTPTLPTAASATQHLPSAAPPPWQLNAPPPSHQALMQRPPPQQAPAPLPPHMPAATPSRLPHVASPPLPHARHHGSADTAPSTGGSRNRPGGIMAPSHATSASSQLLAPVDWSLQAARAPPPTAGPRGGRRKMQRITTTVDQSTD